mgnify:CR=1 FL=1
MICKAETVQPFTSEYEKFFAEFKEQIEAIDSIDSKYVHLGNLDDVRRTIATCLGWGEDLIKIVTIDVRREFPGFEGFLGRIALFWKHGTLFNPITTVDRVSVLRPSDGSVWASIVVDEDSLYIWPLLKEKIKRLAKSIFPESFQKD